MSFNFELFNMLCERVYKKIEKPVYSLDDVLEVFGHYFRVYEGTLKEVHPPIRSEQIERLIKAMPFIDDCHGSVADISPEDYEALIKKHYKTKYRNCDYNINHFFSGDIRLLRFYEEL